MTVPDSMSIIPSKPVTLTSVPAAASVVAKVTRDRLMRELAGSFPDYGWATNVGYGTDEHYLGLLRKGPTEHHRKSFAPLNTIFAPMATAWHNFRFVRVVEVNRPDELELFFLRADLHAVFDCDGCHVGLVKNVRGRWTFQALGYGDDGHPELADGPFKRHHGQVLEAPERAALVRLLSSI